jgi:GAF domain-containing protein
MSIAENLKMSQGLQLPLNGGTVTTSADDLMSDSLNASIDTDNFSSHPKFLADEQLVALHEVIKTVSRERNMRRALAVITEKARLLTSCTSTALALLDNDRETLDFMAVAGQGASEMIGQRVRVTDALPGRTAITGEPLLAYSPSKSPVSDTAANSFSPQDLITPTDRQSGSGLETDDSFSGHGGIRSAAVVPIFLDGKSIGSLAAINRQDGLSFTSSDLLILHILASASASVLQAESLRSQNAQTERERDILFEAARRTSSTLNVQQILDGVMSTIGKSIDSFAEIIFLLNDDRTHLFIASERGLTEEEVEIQLLAEDRLAAAAFNRPGGTPYIISSGAEDPRYEVILPEERVQPASLLVAPLVSRDNPIGLIVVISIHPNAFTADDLRLVSAVAAQTAVAVENAWLYEDATRRAEEATAIYELSQSVNTNLNLQRVLNFVADSVIGLLHVDKFALFLHNPRTHQLEIQVGRNLRRELVKEMRCQADRGGIAWWVYQFETPTAVQNVALDHRNRSCPIDQENVASLVSVPLQAGDEVIGVIHAMSSRPRLFTVAEMELLYTIANQVGVAIRNTQTLEHMRQKSVDLRRASRLVSKALGASLDSPGAPQTIADLASEILAADRCLLYSNEDGALKLVAAHGVRATNLVEINQSAGAITVERETTASVIARKGKTLILSKDSLDAQLVVAQEYNSLLRSGTYIGIPLKVGTQVVGVLEAFVREERVITGDDMRHFKAFGGQAAVALQNALLVQKATRRRTDLQMLSSLAGSLAKCEQGDEPVYGALASLAEAVSADYVRLKCLNKEFVWNGETYSKIEPNSENCYVLTVQVQKGRSICGEDGELAVYRGLESQDFAEPDRYLTQTVADMLCATILS